MDSYQIKVSQLSFETPSLLTRGWIHVNRFRCFLEALYEWISNIQFIKFMMLCHAVQSNLAKQGTYSLCSSKEAVRGIYLQPLGTL